MVKQCYFLLLLLLHGSSVVAQEAAPERKLFPFFVRDLWGYLNATGQVVVAPQFKAAGIFSEGLAPVRPAGLYGYIDLTGKMVIAPQFDFAGAFHDSAAWVFQNGKPALIGHNGLKRFENTWEHLGPVINRNLVKAWISDSTATLLDFHGRRTMTQEMDGIYVGYPQNRYRFLWFSDYYRHRDNMNGLSMGSLKDSGDTLKPHNHMDGGWKNYVLDRSGRPSWEVKKDEALYPLGGGYFELRNSYRLKPEFAYLVNSEGKRLLPIEGSIYPGIVNEGKVTIKSMRLDTAHQDYWPMYVVDTQGQIVLRPHADWSHISAFSSNRAFVRSSRGWMMIDVQGREINQTPYDSVFLNDIGYYSYEYSLPFHNGRAFVFQGGSWQQIDTTGWIVGSSRELSPFHMPGITAVGELARSGNVLFVFKRGASRCHSFVQGFWNPESETLVMPKYCMIDTAHFNDSLVAVCDTGHRWAYIDRCGREIWKEASPHGQQRTPSNIDFRFRSHYRATSMNAWYLEGSDVTATDYRPNPPELQLPRDTLSLIVRPSDSARWLGRYEADLLLVANTTADTMWCNKRGYQLHLTLEALDPEGKWLPLDDPDFLDDPVKTGAYLPPGQYWSFAVPHFHGSFKTSMRVRLHQAFVRSHADPKHPWKWATEFYSPEVQVMINPAQLWRTRPIYDYYDGVDPYLQLGSH